MKKFLAILLTLLLALSLGASFAEEAAEENAGYTLDVYKRQRPARTCMQQALACAI